jgi:hypothetical protein
LGTPLAPPRRRAAAVLIDLFVVGLITALTSGFWFVLGVVAAAFFFTTARKPGKGDGVAKVFRLFLGCMGVTTLLVTVVIFIGLRFLDENDGRPVFNASLTSDSTEINLSGGLEGVLGGIAEGAQILTSETPEEVVTLATRLGRRLEATMTRDEVEEALAELIPDEVGDTDGDDLLERVMTNLDSSAESEAAELDDESRLTTEAEAERAMAEALTLAGDTIEELQDRLDRAERDREKAETDLQQAQERSGLFGWLADRIESLGFGLGWWTMYFAILMPWMKGQTPGKRALGIRVVRLDGHPVTWWHAFERAGGYAAGLATGTLGFVQIYWDPNRQAIHDKIAGTVVVLDGAQRLPGRWDLADDDTAYVLTEPPRDE